MLRDATDDALAALTAANAVERIWARDHTLWQDHPTEVADRLGWLDSPAEMLDRVGELESFAVGLVSNGFTHAVLSGMGGSSLFPEVAARTFGPGGALELHVLDSTDPAAVARARDELPLDRTLVVAASKSGTTVETRSHLAYFLEVVGVPAQFAVITDPGTPLASLARDRGFQAVFENRPDIGGRYSALSHFGLVPAALVGLDLEELLVRALRMVERCRGAELENPGVALGAALGAAALAGRDKLTLRLAPSVAAFGAWIEQLVAESTGKEGRGIVPVDGEGRRRPGEYGRDRFFAGIGADAAVDGHPGVSFPLDDPYDLGGEVFRWEMATAVAGHLLGVNPFDQPDVQAAKDATGRVLREGLPELAPEPVEPLLDRVGEGDYLAVQAFVDPGGDLAGPLRAATDALGRRLGVPATFGLGPRYLHSTGQLHKGGPPTGVFLQVVGPDSRDVEVPGAGYSFGELKQAQAAGDLLALRERGLRVARVAPDALIRVAS